MYKLIKNISLDNFLFGGLIYHHKEIIDPEKRDEEFQKMVIRQSGKEIYSIDEIEVGVENIYSIAATLKNIQKSQSLSQYAMNKTMEYFGAESVPYPIDTIYENKEHKNAFIDNGIKIIDSDLIIFISMKGILGGTYDSGNEKQKLAIRYKYDEELDINIGEVFDLKLYEDFLEYKKYVGDMKL